MKKRLMLIVMVIFAVFAALLLSGCGSDQADQQTGAEEEPPAGTQEAQTGSSGCKSPYDGTYSGTVSGSGEREKWDFSSGQEVKTPYIITYNLELTSECVSYGKDSWGGDDKGWEVHMTHAKASDPFFGCQNGCELVNSGGFIPEDGQRGGGLYIEFPNGASIGVHSLQGSDGSIISTDQLNPEKVISGSYPGSGETDSIERRMFPDSSIHQEGFTMRLNKIS